MLFDEGAWRVTWKPHQPEGKLGNLANLEATSIRGLKTKYTKKGTKNIGNKSSLLKVEWLIKINIEAPM